MHYRKFVKYWLTATLTLFSAIGLFNLYIDPLWCFSHSNRWNNHQDGFNERQQKTNRIFFTDMLKRSDSLLLGSSRTAYVNQYDFKGMKVFNYAADNMLPPEYEKWIEIAKSIKGDFKNIIIGVDFFGTAENYDEVIERFYGHKKPEAYLHTTTGFLYRYKMLFTADSAKHSLKAVTRTLKPTISDYDRKNVRHASIRISPQQVEKNIKRDIGEYLPHLTKKYRYRSNWPQLLERLKKNNPESRFYIFTTPVSEPFFKKFIIESNHIDDYFRWLRETILVFGEVYHFMDLNTITLNLDNFFDAHHVYAPVDRMIAHKISGYGLEKIPDDFGIVLTKENIDEYERAFREKLSVNLLESK